MKTEYSIRYYTQKVKIWSLITFSSANMISIESLVCCFYVYSTFTRTAQVIFQGIKSLIAENIILEAIGIFVNFSIEVSSIFIIIEVGWGFSIYAGKNYANRIYTNSKYGICMLLLFLLVMRFNSVTLSKENHIYN